MEEFICGFRRRNIIVLVRRSATFLIMFIILFISRSVPITAKEIDPQSVGAAFDSVESQVFEMNELREGVDDVVVITGGCHEVTTEIEVAKTKDR